MARPSLLGLCAGLPELLLKTPSAHCRLKDLREPPHRKDHTARVGARWLQSSMPVRLTVLAVVAGLASALCEEARLGRDGGDIDFGSAVSMSSNGELVLVGAPLDQLKGFWSGSASVFSLSGNTPLEPNLEATLLPIDGESYDRFGYSVSLSGNGERAVIGSPGTGDQIVDYSYEYGQVYYYTPGHLGSVHIFAWNGTDWVAEAKVLSPGPDSDNFGASVSIDTNGERLIVGAPLTRGTFHGYDAEGAAYVYAWVGANWILVSELFGGVPGTNFGHSVSFDENGERSLVGAVSSGGPTDPGPHGRAFVIRFAWTRTGVTVTQEAVLWSLAGQDFGWSTSMSWSGERAIVGAPGLSATRAGLAEIYAWTGTVWEREAVLDNDHNSRSFGQTVSLSGNGRRAIVCAPLDGAAYFYNWDGESWALATTFQPGVGPGVSFGASASQSLDAELTVIGAPPFGEHGAYILSTASPCLTSTESASASRSVSLSESPSPSATPSASATASLSSSPSSARDVIATASAPEPSSRAGAVVGAAVGSVAVVAVAVSIGFVWWQRSRGRKALSPSSARPSIYNARPAGPAAALETPVVVPVYPMLPAYHVPDAPPSYAAAMDLEPDRTPARPADGRQESYSQLPKEARPSAPPAI